MRKKPHKTVSGTNAKRLIAIASSTGGPKALQSVIPFLPKNLDAPMVLVQHMPAGFTKSMAERLNEVSPIAVKEAVEASGNTFVPISLPSITILPFWPNSLSFLSTNCLTSATVAMGLTFPATASDLISFSIHLSPMYVPP